MTDGNPRRSGTRLPHRIPPPLADDDQPPAIVGCLASIAGGLMIAIMLIFGALWEAA